MDVKLQNAYVEVLLGNFLEVVKQNIMFQAQLEVSNKDSNAVSEAEKSISEFQRRLKEVSDSNIELQKQLIEKDKEFQRVSSEKNIISSERDNLKNSSTANSNLAQEKQKLQTELAEKDKELQRVSSEKESLKNLSTANNTLVQEKQRLQNAVNDYMRQLNDSKTELLRVKSESQDVLLQNNNRIEDLTKYISRLEAAIPANKLKKVKLGEVVQTELPEVTEIKSSLPIDEESVKNGGTF